MNKRAQVSIRAQAALEYLLTYGWALVVIAIVLGSIMFLTSNAASPHNCQMNPSSGALTYVDYYVSPGILSIMLQNDSGKTISDVNLSFSGDFISVASKTGNGPYTSAQQFSISTTGLSLNSGTAYSNGIIIINYKRNNVIHVSTAVCTGVI